MKCFEWQNHSSEYLDGELLEPWKSQADEHLHSCDTCSDRLEHYRLILESISRQPRATLPVPIRPILEPGAPTGEPLSPRKRIARWWAYSVRPWRRRWRYRWERLPWFLRTSLEGTGIVLFILLGISATPRIRGWYERSMESRLDEFNDVLSSPETGSAAETAAANLAISRGQAAPDPQAGAQAARDEFASEGEADSSENDSGDADAGDAASDAQTSENDTTVTGPDGERIRVGAGEVWRFNLKTDSPYDYRPKVIQILTDAKLPPNTPGLGGIEAPGGIQFDLLVPRASVAVLKKKLEQLAPPIAQELVDTPMGETFTWYKNRSKAKIPDGKTRIVVWLSQN